MASESLNLTNRLIITNAAMTTNASSGAIDISSLSNYSVHFVWTGTPTGTLNVSISNDGVNFDPLGTAVSLTGSAGNKMFKDSDTGYKFIKADYTFSSGTGTLNATLNGKTP